MEEGRREIRNLEFRWRSGRWFTLVFLFNIPIPFLILLERIIGRNDEMHSNFIIPQMVIFPTLLSMSFLAYVYLSRKFAEENGEVIKGGRYRYFHWGLLMSFAAFCVYVVFLVATVVGRNRPDEHWPSIVIYVCLALDCIIGTASTALITVYEFCVSFDIFYSRNKIDIVKEYLRRTGTEFKIEERGEVDED